MITVGDYSIDQIRDILFPVKKWGFYRSRMNFKGEYMELRVRVLRMLDSNTVTVRKLVVSGNWNGKFREKYYGGAQMHIPLEIFKKHFHPC